MSDYKIFNEKEKIHEIMLPSEFISFFSQLFKQKSSSSPSNLSSNNHRISSAKSFSYFFNFSSHNLLLESNVFRISFVILFLFILLLPLAKASVVLNATDFIGFNISASEVARIVSGGLIVSGGWVNATNAAFNKICLSNDCKTSWPTGGLSPWDNSTTQIFVREGFPLFVNISNALFVNGTSFSIQLQPSSTLPIPLNGTIYYDASLNKFRCYQNGVWTDCITSVPESASGFWVLTGSMLYPNQTSWNVGIGTNVPREKLEVQGRILVASSNPFELEPSDGILDVKGSINATGSLYVGGTIYGTLAPNIVATTNIQDGAVTTTKIADNAVTSAKLAQDAASIGKITGTIYLTAIGGNVGIGTSSPIKKLDVVGDINATSNLFVGGNNIYGSGGILRIALGDTTNVYTSLFNISGNLMVYGNNIQNSTGTTRISFYPGYILFNDNIRVGGNVIQDSVGINRITIGDTTSINASLVLSAGNWVNASNFYASNLICLGGICKNTWPSSSLVGGSGANGQVAFWSSGDTISGDNELYWDNSSKRLGIGTNVPREKLEVQGRILVASSNPFELEPSDGILDVKGSINATVVIFIPKHSSQPFACDASKAGAIFYNTTDNKFYGCNSTSWVIIGG